MDSRYFVSVLAIFVLSTVSFATAQQPKKFFRIGYLSSADPASDSARSAGVRRGLRELGYIEGQNIAIESRYAEGKRNRFPELAAELVRLKVDVIVIAGGDLLTKAAMTATKTIPIVMTGSGADPVEAGLVDSLARPGGNVTGVTLLNKDLGGKRLELLKAAVPKITQVAAFYDSAIPPNVVEVNEVLPGVARALGVTTKLWAVGTPDDFEKVFAAMTKERLDALYVLQGPLMRANQKRIISFGMKGRLPSMFSNRESIDDGGLAYYGADLTDSYKRVANYVDRILKGTKPANLPVEQPTKFEFVINLKTAKQIGLTIPPEVLARASKIIR